MNVFLLHVADAAAEALISQFAVDENFAGYLAGCGPVGEDVQKRRLASPGSALRAGQHGMKLE